VSGVVLILNAALLASDQPHAAEAIGLFVYRSGRLRGPDVWCAAPQNKNIARPGCPWPRNISEAWLLESAH
jgi:hypothetical protein